MKRSNNGTRIVQIAVAGPGAGGKTELTNRFAERGFLGNAPATIGANFLTRKFEQNEEEYILQIWDTAGHERFFATNSIFVKRAMGAVFVYDITSEDNFVATKETIDQHKANSDLEDTEMIIVGNKCDMEDEREVSKLRGHQLAEEYGAKFFEVSAKTNANVQGAFTTLVRDTIARVTGKKVTVPEEIVHDPYALQLYEKALQAGTEKDKSIRVNIVGNFMQGKTTLMKRLLGQKVKDITSTNGITVEHYKCEKTKDGKLRYTKADDIDNSDYVKRLVSVAITENSENEEQQTQPLTKSDTLQENNTTMPEYTPSHKDVRETQSNLNSETKGISSNDNETLEDVLNRVSLLSPEEKEDFAKALKTYQSFSQPDRQTIFDIWDFGGQYIFYATHTIFHSKRAIYLLVVDLSLDLNQCITDKQFPMEMEARNMKYFIQFWMSSIHSFVGSADGSVPKVILVGTHKDKLKGRKHEIEKYIQKYFMDIREMFDGTNMSYHIHFDDFAVDNTDANDPSLNSLRETIVRVGDEQSETYEIPLKWIQLEKSLIERKHLKLISLKFVLAIDSQNEFPLGDMEQVKLFLRFHHTKGTFVYFDEEPISGYVVLDPQYLIDAFKCIITSERFCTNDPDIRPLWNRLLKEGRLEANLIDRQWGKAEDKFKMYKENKDTLLAFLVKHHIISEAAVFDENTHQSTGLGWFVVPSLLKDHSSRTEIKDFLSGKKWTKLRYVLLFHTSPIVPTVYHRLVSAAIGKWSVAKSGKKSLIFKDMCVVRLNIGHAGIVEIKHNSIEMTAVSLCPTTDVNGEQADIFRRFSEAVVANEFQKLRSTEETHIKPYTVWFRCSHEEHGEDGSENLISFEDLEAEKVVPCPDLMTHDINAEEAKEQWFQSNRKIIVIHDRNLTEKLLSNIAQCIGENWQLIGLELGLTQVQLDHIFEDNPRSAVMRIYVMLQLWFREDEDKATLKVLVETIQRCSHVHIDWDKLRNIIDEVN